MHRWDVRTRTLGLVSYGLIGLGLFTTLGFEQEIQDPYDPIRVAMGSVGKVENMEAGVPGQCYTQTAGVANPCWTCHTHSVFPNTQDDWMLQEEYAFSDFALTNRWKNLFEDRREETAKISDEETMRWIRQDNYGALRRALMKLDGYPGHVPDLDFSRGFDEEGFAADGSGWRALRFKPFPGTFWPTNGNTDDVFIRLPESFRHDRTGRPSRAIYKINLAILEAAIAALPPPAALRRRVEPIDEAVAATDLDADGKVSGRIEVIKSLPSHYVGAAAKVKVHRYLYPDGVEFLHTVRYIDPDSPTLHSRRMKEVRYSAKRRWLDTWAVLHRYEEELDNKQNGMLPQYAGDPSVGLRNEFGWQLQGFIEDKKGRLRLQTEEEHRSCMGCHSALGVTVDQTFTLARKVPGSAGWRYQDLRGMHDAPQASHTEPEALTYFRRVHGADEYRANAEMLQRFFKQTKGFRHQVVDADKVRRAARGGDKDLAWLLAPSRERALALNKAYMVIQRRQAYRLGKDALLAPPANVHPKIENGATELDKTGKVFLDGRIWLDWDR